LIGYEASTEGEQKSKKAKKSKKKAGRQKIQQPEKPSEFVRYGDNCMLGIAAHPSARHSGRVEVEPAL
jgi:hypothetical protein